MGGDALRPLPVTLQVEEESTEYLLIRASLAGPWDDMGEGSGATW